MIHYEGDQFTINICPKDFKIESLTTLNMNEKEDNPS